MPGTPLDPVVAAVRDGLAPLQDVLSTLQEVAAALHRLEATLAAIQAAFDFTQRFTDTINGWVIDPLQTGVSMITATTAIPHQPPFAKGPPFTTDATIGDWMPLAAALAMTALVAVVVWAFYRVMFAHGSFTQYTVRIMLPRFVIAAGAIYFARNLVQAAVDFDNALTAAIVGHALQPDYLLAMLRQWLLEIGTAQPGPGPAVAAALLVGFLLLMLVYCVRYALLVVLTILAPIAALLLILPDTKKYAVEWGSLFITTLLMQPLQVFILSVGLSLEARGISPFRHAFALAALWMCFKVPGALRTASTVGSHAESMVHKQASQVIKMAGKVARVAL